MSQLIPYPAVDSANSSSSITDQLAKGAKGAVCGAYHTYKDWYNQNVGIDTLQGALLNAFWSNACPNEPPYSPPPPSKFSGGQCAGVIYRFNIFGLAYGYESSSGERYTDNELNLVGPVKDIYWTSVAYNNPPYDTRTYFYSYDSGPYYYAADRIIDTTGPWKGRVELYRADGQPDNCGNLPGSNPPVISPPPTINNNFTINNKGNNINVSGSFNPKFISPTLNLNFKVPLTLNIGNNPQFNGNPTLNFNFGSGGVSVDGGDNDTINNLGDNINNLGDTINNLGDNINNINNTTNNTNNTINNIKNTNDDNNFIIREIKDKLACNPCDLLEEIKKKLNYSPVFTSSAINNFQSVTKDDIPNVGYLQIQLIQLPKLGKTVFGGQADNTMYTGWLVWRRDSFNFEKIQITTANSTYWSPKWANGFSICCTNNARANCIYWIEVKD